MGRTWPVLVVALAFLPVAAAQGPTMPRANVNISGMPDTMQTVPVGGEKSVTFQVSIQFQGVVCPQASTAVVALSFVEDGGPLGGLALQLSESELTFDLEASVLPFGGQGPPPQDVMLTATASDTVAPNTHHGLNVTATYAGGVPAGCQSGAAVPEDSETADLAFMTGAGAGGPSGSSTTTPSQESGGDAGGKGIPGPPLVLLLAGLALAIAFRRRT